jgi:deoxyadenosine/deoxycytidine kinase
MGKLISVVGNLGSGKTTLTKILCDRGSFVPYWEKPEERPFQMDFTNDLPRWALANQMDFLVFRCQQELLARQNQETAVMDGGLDQDFHVFTKNLYDKGYLQKREFDICERFYKVVRSVLPPPDIIIKINIDSPTLLQRRLSRERKTVDCLFDTKEFTDLENLLGAWVAGEKYSTVIYFTFEQGFNNSFREIDALIEQIKVQSLSLRNQRG